MLLDQRKRVERAIGGVDPPRHMVEVQARAVIDQPQLAVPDEQVGIAHRPIDVADVGIEPHQPRRDIGVGRVDERIEHHRARQVIEREIESAAGANQRENFRVGLGARQVGVELGEDEIRHRQLQRPRDLAGDELRDERPRPLPRPAKLQHVEPVVVGFDDGGQRSALAQRRHVTGDANSFQLAHRIVSDVIQDGPRADRSAARRPDRSRRRESTADLRGTPSCRSSARPALPGAPASSWPSPV